MSLKLHDSRECEGPVVPNEAAVAACMLARVLPGADVPASNVLAATHPARIRGRLLHAGSSNIPRALLIVRIFEVDMNVCP